MEVIFNNIKCEIDKQLSKEEKELVDYMRKHGFLFTYYAQEDSMVKNKTGSSVKGVTLDLGGKKKIKI